MSFSEHITPQHLSLKALIYIRQSTPSQVLNNQESQQLQQALVQRAHKLGWSLDNIEAIDSDLGLTGSSAIHRQGFQYLIAQVAAGLVGIVFSYDVTRLSRNCSDWYPLLDICSYKNTLIGDRESVYDPRTSNGRLILGLKGQFAEIELNTIRARMNEGLLNKAKRGDLIFNLPTGFVRPHKNVVVKDPNLEVQNCIQTIFEIFLKKKSAAKVLRFFIENNLKIPRYHDQELHWKKPNIAAILSILKNPAYAGANVYGRSQTSIVDFESKKKSQKKLPIEEWKYITKDRFPAYISWETFEGIQKLLKDNYAEYDRNKTRGIPRPGKALLQGVIYCGVCGHKMVIQYKGGTRYLCNALRQQYGVAVCQYLSADPIDDYVVDAFFQSISPIELNTYETLLHEQSSQITAVNKMKKQQLERLNYQVRLAEKQFNQVDPDNRLVAAELEKRWELALKELKNAEQEYEKESEKKKEILCKIPDELKKAFTDLGKSLPNVWKDVSQKNKKAFLRCMIDKVVLHKKASHAVEIRIVWQGGDTTTKEILVPVKNFRDLPFAKEFESEILELARHGKKDVEIAENLTKKGYYSPSSKKVLPSTVQIIRLKNGYMLKRSQSHPSLIKNHLTVPQLAKRIGVPKHWIYDRIHNGKIKVLKDSNKGVYKFPDTEETISLVANLKKLEFLEPS